MINPMTLSIPRMPQEEEQQEPITTEEVEIGAQMDQNGPKLQTGLK